METSYYATDYYLVDHGEKECCDISENYMIAQDEINTRIYILGRKKNELWVISHLLGLRFGIRNMKKHELIKCILHVIRELKKCPARQINECYC